MWSQNNINIAVLKDSLKVQTKKSNDAINTKGPC